MKALSAAIALVVVLLCTGAGAAPPDAETLKKAAGAFDDGSRAYKAGQFELAASYFEAADAAVPSARALRMAIRARSEAEQPARASTLAELALARHPNDTSTRALAEKTVKDNAAALHRLRIKCTSPCVLAVASRSVPGAAAKRWILWVPPGETSIGASFSGAAGADQQVIAARAGGDNTLSFVPGATAPEEPAPRPAPSVAPIEPAPAVQPPVEPDRIDPEVDDGPSWIEHPAVFVVSLIATAGAGGVLIWSGIDTLKSPGEDVVREACVGQGTECPEYQEGLDSQLRTNILIGATAGLGLVTGIIGIFVTEWGGDDESPESATSVTVSPSGGAIMWRRSF